MVVHVSGTQVGATIGAVRFRVNGRIGIVASLARAIERRTRLRVEPPREEGQGDQHTFYHAMLTRTDRHGTHVQGEIRFAVPTYALQVPYPAS